MSYHDFDARPTPRSAPRSTRTAGLYAARLRLHGRRPALTGIVAYAAAASGYYQAIAEQRD